MQIPLKTVNVYNYIFQMEASINAAIKKGYLQQIRFLLEFGHSIHERDENQRTPLINCAFIDDDAWAVGIARLFIEKGARISLYDKFGLNALHYAALQEKRPLIQLYLSALDFNINAGDKFGNTALHYAASTGNVEILRDLVLTHAKYGISVNKTNKKGETALIQAWKAGNFECGTVLVDVAGADEDIKDNVEGLTAREWQRYSENRISLEENQQRVKSATARRPKTSIKRVQLHSARSPLGNNNRPPSAPVMAKRKSSTVSRAGKENLLCDPVPPVLRKTKSSVYYQAAGMDDLRNNPRYVFQLSPVDYFTNKYDQNKYSYPFGYRHRSLSADCKSRYSSVNNIEAMINSNWRNALKTYMISYDYQFAHSYRRTAVPPEPEPEENPDERPDSPGASDNDDAASHSSKKGSKKQEKNDKKKDKEKEKDKISRKTSTLTVPNSLGHADSSSSESINTKGNQRRVSRVADEHMNSKSKSSASRNGIHSRTSFIKK